MRDPRADIEALLLNAMMLAALALSRHVARSAASDRRCSGHGRIDACEAAAALGLLLTVAWLAGIEPASGETSGAWPLPFRLSWAATWGFFGLKLPWIGVPGWWSAPAWSGVAALVFATIAAALWWTPAAPNWRRYAMAIALAMAPLCAFASFATQAYPETFVDPSVDYTAESVMRGQAHFERRCAACHGATGEGDGEFAKGLRVAPADLTAPHVGIHTVGDIFHWLTFGGQSGVMPGFNDVLTPDDRWDVINFLVMLSYSKRSRFIGANAMARWLVAPDFKLLAPDGRSTTFYGLRGAPTLLSFARCNAPGVDEAALEASLEYADKAAKDAGAHHVAVYQGGCPDRVLLRVPVFSRFCHKSRNGCPEKLLAFVPTHPRAVESAYSLINRYPNELPTPAVAEAHFLIDRSGYVRSRIRHIENDDGQATQLRRLLAQYAEEPLAPISPHPH